MSQDVRQQLGRTGEDLACEHLVRRGFEILERNFRTRWGELDIVAFDETALVFCEVKTRRLPLAGGAPFEAVDGAKRRQLRRMAGRWLVEREKRPFAPVLRFDAIAVTLDRQGHLVALEHLEDAF